jgi:hypothetical protein
MRKQFRDFESAREFARSLGLENFKEWTEYCKAGDKPDDIPTDPYQHYKNEFTGVGDFLGTGFVAMHNRKYRPYKEAREFARSLGLRSNLDWRKYFKLNKRPDDIPYKVERIYKKEWKGWGDFLGTGFIASQDMVIIPFTEAKKFAILLNLKSFKEWQKYCKAGDKPDDIPANPNRSYKKEWKGWGDFLGTKFVATYSRKYLSAKEAKPVLKKLFKEHNIKNFSDWQKFAKTHVKLLEELKLPAAILRIYSIDNANRKSKK